MTRRLILGLLAAHLAIAHLDRQILSFGLPGIREHFELSDLQLGLLGGVAFGLFFGLASVPLSLMIGRFNRKFVLSISISLWSLLTLMGELALGFWHLFVSRVGVGAAEAAAIPAAQSIVADRFEDKHRATAMSIYAAGANIGVAIALIGGGSSSKVLAGGLASSWQGCLVCSSPCFYPCGSPPSPPKSLWETGQVHLGSWSKSYR